jgi:hypothetical protein
MWPRMIKIIGMLLILPVLLGGTHCVFIATSGGSHHHKDRDNALFVFVHQGRFVDSPVEGLRYVSGTLSGTTGPDGEFRFEDGATVAFFIGDIQLGSAVPGKALMTPVDLVPGAGVDSPAAINIARLLQSLDARPGDGRISIPASVHALARRSNDAVGAWIDALDFGDEARFVNAASQLVATLTESYGFTAVLVDRATARQRMLESLAPLGSGASRPD